MRRAFLCLGLTQRAVRDMAGMTWAEGDQWSVAVDLPPGVYEFKLVAVLGDSGEPVEWEAGDNRQLTVRLTFHTVHTLQTWQAPVCDCHWWLSATWRVVSQECAPSEVA